MKRVFYLRLIKFDDGTSIPLKTDEEHLDLATLWVEKEFPLLSQYQHVTEITGWHRFEFDNEEGEDGRD